MTTVDQDDCVCSIPDSIRIIQSVYPVNFLGLDVIKLLDT